VSKAQTVKVAIIGGGCAAVAAAFELSRPEHNHRYQITVYQVGWRLGGKGASGRGPAERIEEHGFHVWMGWYENAFRLMRECYAELNRDRRKCRMADWRDAFVPAPFVALAQTAEPDAYRTFLSHFPPGDGLPGDPITEENPFSVASYVVRTLSLLRTMLLTILGSPGGGDNNGSQKLSSESLGAMSREPSTRISRLIRVGVLTMSAALIEALGVVELAIRALEPKANERLLSLLENLARTIRQQVGLVVNDDPQLLLVWHALDVGVTAVLGIVRFGLLTDPRGFDAINEYDFREWMRLNGVSEAAIESPLIRGAYDLAFAYEDGDYAKPRHGAGVALRGSLRMLFSSRGALLWKMHAGMGEVVFAPFYEVLKRRGVSFEFFHRLEQVKLAKPGARGLGEDGA
jgi:uncharacterized protein with NAD-binding domain and iron-sulfur cluster